MSEEEEEDRDFVVDVIVSHHQRVPSQIQTINEMPLYPTEEVYKSNRLCF